MEAIYNQLGDELRVSLISAITTRPAGSGYLTIVEIIPISGLKIVVRDKNVRRA